jgi:Rieske Fe-S protein
MQRRGFVNWFLGLSSTALFGFVLYPAWRFVNPPDVPEASTNRVEAGFTNDPDLLERGFKILEFGSEPVILIRVADDDYRAFSGTCTHLDCIVEFQSAERRIWCNCHNGEYSLNGEVVAGPPPRHLETFAVDLVDNGASQPRSIVVSRERA